MTVPQPTYPELVAALHTRFASAGTVITEFLDEEPVVVDAPPLLYTLFVSATYDPRAPVQVTSYTLQSTIVGYKIGGRSDTEAAIMALVPPLVASVNNTVEGRRLGLTTYTRGLATVTRSTGKWMLIGGDLHRIVDLITEIVLK